MSVIDEGAMLSWIAGVVFGASLMGGDASSIIGGVVVSLLAAIYVRRLADA